MNIKLSQFTNSRIEHSGDYEFIEYKGFDVYIEKRFGGYDLTVGLMEDGENPQTTVYIQHQDYIHVENAAEVKSTVEELVDELLGELEMTPAQAIKHLRKIIWEDGNFKEGLNALDYLDQ